MRVNAGTWVLTWVLKERNMKPGRYLSTGSPAHVKRLTYLDLSLFLPKLLMLLCLARR